MFTRGACNDERGSDAGKYRSARKHPIAFLTDSDGAIGGNLREHGVAKRRAEHRYRAQIRFQQTGKRGLQRTVAPLLQQNLRKAVKAAAAGFSRQQLRELPAIIHAHAFARVENERADAIPGQCMNVAVDRLG